MAELLRYGQEDGQPPRVQWDRAVGEVVVMEQFGLRVRQARERADMTQARLAELAGITRESLYRIENGRPPLAETAAALHRALVRHLPGLSLDMRLTESRDTVGAVRRRDFLAASAVVPATLALRMIALDRRPAADLDPGLLDVWEERTANFAAARAVEPPRLLLPQIEQHLSVLETLVGQWPGPEPLRRRLLSIAAGTNAIAAWVSLMAERRREVHDYLDRGEDLAREAGDDSSLLLLLMLRADLLSPVLLGGDGGFPEQAMRALDEAMSLAGPMSPLTLRVPVVLRAAEEHAAAGDRDAALRLLEQGAELQERSRVPSHYLRRRWPEWSWASYAGSVYNLLGMSPEAIATLGPIRSPFPSHQPLLLTDRGAAHAQAGDLDQAAQLLGEALRIAMDHGYPEAARRVQGVRRRHLSAWHDEPRVRELDEVIAGIL